jgi:subtilase family serine protease
MTNMPTKQIYAAIILSVVAFFLLLPIFASAQTSNVAPRITAAVDGTNLTVLRGNTHPLARAQYDRGSAPASLTMGHMLLVLQRSPAQEAALETLMAQQQDSKSANYHKWLTPQQFGEQFGPADQDIQTITSWLQSNGFQVGAVSHGRTLIDFSGTAGQVQLAFHTAIHRYVLANGEQHWANSTDPAIPVALAPVVVGVNKLNDFHPKPMHRVLGTFKKSVTTGKVSRAAPNPKFTYPAGYCYTSDSNCYAVGPYDFDTIYSVPATVSGAVPGTGEAIAIVSDSDVYDSDVTNFRSLLGLQPVPNPGNIITRVIPTGLTNPGVQFCEANSDEEEAVIDAEWSGAAAPGAYLDMVISPSSENCNDVANEPGFVNGWDYSAYWIVDNYNNVNIFPHTPHILSDSYGECELALGTTDNAFYNTEWQQAAAEGITVSVAAGDSGSAGCDYLDYSSSDPLQPAQYGLAVTGSASTPYNVAVGGTDFDYPNFNNPSAYWSSSNTTSGATTTASALGYIPEMVWNETCTNSAIYLGQVGSLGLSSAGNAASACNSVSFEDEYLIGATGGGGGVSNCTTPGGSVPADCSGGYAKPLWQVGTGVPVDGKRDVPDVSLFAGIGITSGTAYVVCEEDLNPEPIPCNLTQSTEIDGGLYYYFVAEGGTSVGAQAFAGIAALMDQKLGSHGLGNINPQLYALASEQPSIFHDITVGTNAMACVPGTGIIPPSTTSPCTVVGNNEIGVLSGYSATTGYDQATGLGSVNVTSLVNNAGPNFYLSPPLEGAIVTVPSPGMSGNMVITLASVDGFSGSVTLSCSALPTGATCLFNPPNPIALTATGPGSSQAVTVTVDTTSASRLGPSTYFTGPKGWTVSREWMLAGALLLCATPFLLASFGKRQRVGSVLVFVAMAVLLAVVGCGGGGSSAVVPPPPVGPTPSVLTATSGNLAFPMNFVVNIN